MKAANIINIDIDDRIDRIIKEAMTLYIAKLMYGLLNRGLEASFQLHLARIIESLTEIYTFTLDEKFQVLLENNIPINEKKDYIDIIIKYSNKNEERLYLIELKYKKKSDSASDLGNIFSYIDMCNLDFHRNNTENVKGCYFIFLTDLKTYIYSSKKGTRKELPMHDGANIEENKYYNVTGNFAKNKMGLYSETGFKFHKSHNIEYYNFKIKEKYSKEDLEKEFWYFIEKF